jgi:putative flippase GtrA
VTANAAPARRGWRVVARHQLGAAVATGADFGVMIACVQAGLPAAAGTAVGAGAGAGVSFALGRHWIFPAGSRERVHVQAIRYGLVSLASLALNALGEFVLHDVGRLQYVVARVLVAGVVGLAWNYPLQRGWVFAGRTNVSERASERRQNRRFA